MPTPSPLIDLIRDRVGEHFGPGYRVSATECQNPHTFQIVVSDSRHSVSYHIPVEYLLLHRDAVQGLDWALREAVRELSNGFTLHEQPSRIFRGPDVYDDHLLTSCAAMHMTEAQTIRVLAQENRALRARELDRALHITQPMKFYLPDVSDTVQVTATNKQNPVPFWDRVRKPQL